MDSESWVLYCRWTIPPSLDTNSNTNVNKLAEYHSLTSMHYVFWEKKKKKTLGLKCQRFSLTGFHLVCLSSHHLHHYLSADWLLAPACHRGAGLLFFQAYSWSMITFDGSERVTWVCVQNSDKLWHTRKLPFTRFSRWLTETQEHDAFMCFEQKKKENRTSEVINNPCGIVGTLHQIAFIFPKVSCAVCNL